MQPVKRKTPSWASPSPGPGTGSGTATGGIGSSVASVKQEDGEKDAKRAKMNKAGPSKPIYTASHGMYDDVRTATLDLFHLLKKQATMSYQEAFYRVQDTSPGLDATAALQKLKEMDKVEFREVNEVFMYIPDPTLNSITEIRNHIRVHSTLTSGIPIKSLRDMLPTGIAQLGELEEKGDILIMRALSGPFKDIPLPRLGRKNVNGLKIMEGGNARWKTVFWDHAREAGKAGKKVDEEFIFSWADVPMAENDDVMKLLAEEELTASSAVPVAPKVVPTNQGKKKKKAHRALKITNTHMKELGIDFTKDYEAPT
ncbi:hypothetical protein CI109_104391 [Kwoniella shandongensis]|uniref:Uncharacterized protein n=1 Tax=Kwoniella shandongensis TaxID=1734106 RepID=A0A5M6BWY0_9TREE|nr:uncharacterized protein CI109_004210 [Kwoniella shandongensis]KAA5527397.1 hypothetical protein CI109_004210 [Kwoniella shandongensis]